MICSLESYFSCAAVKYHFFIIFITLCFSSCEILSSGDWGNDDGQKFKKSGSEQLKAYSCCFTGYGECSPIIHSLYYSKYDTIFSSYDKFFFELDKLYNECVQNGEVNESMMYNKYGDYDYSRNDSIFSRDVYLKNDIEELLWAKVEFNPDSIAEYVNNPIYDTVVRYAIRTYYAY